MSVAAVVVSPLITASNQPGDSPFGNAASIVKLPGGGFMMVWSEASAKDGSSGCVVARLFDASGNATGAEFVVNTATTSSQALPHATLLADGNIMVNWQDSSLTGGDASASGVKGQVLSAAGAKIGSEFLVNTTTLNAQSAPTNVLLDNGNVLIAWTDNSATGIDTNAAGIKAQIVTATGAKVGVEFQVNTQIIGAQTNAHVAKLSGGNVMMTWTDAVGDASGSAVKAQILDTSGNKVGGEILINTQTLGAQGLADVAALGNGTFVVTWQDASGTLGDADGTSIKAQLLDANGNKIGGEFLVNTTTVNSQTNPAVAGMSDGSFIITWRDGGPNTGTPEQTLHAQAFNADGTPIGLEFFADQPQDALIEGQPAIADLGGGKFIVSSASSLLVNNVQQTQGLRFELFQQLHQVIGTANGEALDGTAAADSIDGLGGADTIHGMAGDDVIDGGDGNDTIYGDDGGDSIEGGAGNDTIYGGNGNDLIDGGDGDDIIDGGVGNNQVYGGLGNDQLTASSGLDSLYGEEGDDTIVVHINGATQSQNIVGVADGGDGDDVITVDGGKYFVIGGAGNDRLTLLNGQAGGGLYGDAGNDVIVLSNALANAVIGGDGDDDITVTASLMEFGDNLRLSGDDGRDVIRLTGSGTIATGNGPDLVVLDVLAGKTSQRVTITDFRAGEAGDRLDLSAFGPNPFGPGGRLTMTAIQTGLSTLITDSVSGLTIGLDGVRLGNLSAYNLGVAAPQYAPQGLTMDGAFANFPTLQNADELVGADGNDLLRGYGGNDTLYGGGGNDRLDGGLDIDQMYGGTGNDTFVVDNVGDLVVENAGAGTDTVEASISYALGSNVENLTLAGTADLDGTGNAANNVITGNSGGNRLNGGGGTDTLSGGLGDDIYVIDSLDDIVIENANEGSDTIKSSVSYVLAAGVQIENLRLTGIADITMTGNELSSFLIGNPGDNVLDGGGGGDRMKGGYGNDTYIIRNAADVVVEIADSGTNDVVKAAVSYTLGVDAWAETLQTIDAAATTAINLTGNDHTASITGNAGANMLTGGAGGETISGLGGNDTLTGGGGADVFVFASGTGADTITDFTHGDDVIDLSALGFSSFAQVQAASHDNGSGYAVIDLGNGDQVTINAVATAGLQASDFRLSAGAGGAVSAQADAVEPEMPTVDGSAVREAAALFIDHHFATLSFPGDDVWLSSGPSGSFPFGAGDATETAVPSGNGIILADAVPLYIDHHFTPVAMPIELALI